MRGAWVVLRGKAAQREWSGELFCVGSLSKINWVVESITLTLSQWCEFKGISRSNWPSQETRRDNSRIADLQTNNRPSHSIWQSLQERSVYVSFFIVHRLSSHVTQRLLSLQTPLASSRMPSSCPCSTKPSWSLKKVSPPPNISIPPSDSVWATPWVHLHSRTLLGLILVCRSRGYYILRQGIASIGRRGCWWGWWMLGGWERRRGKDFMSILTSLRSLFYYCEIYALIIVFNGWRKDTLTVRASFIIWCPVIVSRDIKDFMWVLMISFLHSSTLEFWHPLSD